MIVGLQFRPFTVFPAWAGVILRKVKRWKIWKGVPRVGGGDPKFHFLLIIPEPCSPRGRG